MDKIFREGTYRTPTVNFDADKGIMELKGKSTPENTMGFYEELVEWAVEYMKNPNEKTNINIRLEYINTGSSKWILTLFKELEKLKVSGHDIMVNWHYEDEDILDIGNDFQSIVNLPFTLIEEEEEDDE